MAMEAVRDMKERNVTEEHPCGSPEEYEKEKRKARAIACILLGCCVLVSVYLIGPHAGQRLVPLDAHGKDHRRL